MQSWWSPFLPSLAFSSGLSFANPAAHPPDRAAQGEEQVNERGRHGSEPFSVILPERNRP